MIQIIVVACISWLERDRLYEKYVQPSWEKENIYVIYKENLFVDETSDWQVFSFLASKSDGMQLFVLNEARSVWQLSFNQLYKMLKMN